MTKKIIFVIITLVLLCAILDGRVDPSKLVVDVWLLFVGNNLDSKYE